MRIAPKHDPLIDSLAELISDAGKLVMVLIVIPAGWLIIAAGAVDWLRIGQ